MASSLRRINTSQAGGSLAFGSVTAGYATLMGPVQGRGVLLVLCNALNVDCIVSLDGGTTDFVRLPASTVLTIELGANTVEYSGTIKVKQSATGAPASGFISAGIVRVE